MNADDFRRVCALAPDALPEPGALYDLHDFSHLACSLLSPELYGGHYYFQTFTILPPYMRELIRSGKWKTLAAVPFSDGLVFSQLSLGLFDDVADKGLSHADVVAYISQHLHEYLMGTRALVQPATGVRLMPGPAPVPRLVFSWANRPNPIVFR